MLRADRNARFGVPFTLLVNFATESGRSGALYRVLTLSYHFSDASAIQLAVPTAGSRGKTQRTRNSCGLQLLSCGEGRHFMLFIAKYKKLLPS